MVNCRVCAINDLFLFFLFSIKSYKKSTVLSNNFYEVDSLLFLVEAEVGELKEKDEGTDEIQVTLHMIS